METPERLPEPEFDPAYGFVDGMPFKWLADYQRMLTDTERAGLQQEGFGIDAAEMVNFESLEDFRDGENNFHVTFTVSPDSRLLVEAYRGRLAFQRFAALYPELLKTLDTRFRGADYHEFSDEDWLTLYETYKTISRLVDKNDPDVVLHDDMVDRMYLCR